MFIELHMIQNFAPSCLNRDDTNTPKDCEFGGYRRARISSQCQKRAMRDYFREAGVFKDGEYAARTKKIKEKLVTVLKENLPDPELAGPVAETTLEGCGLNLKDEKTEYLIFMGEAEIRNMAQVAIDNWEEFQKIASQKKPEKDGGTSKKDAKKKAKKDVPPKIKKELEAVFQGGQSPEIALFGRMLADLPEGKIDAACQVAQAISTNQVEVEFDFYTALDDLSRDLEPGAGMMGTIEFNSACFYRYANLNIEQLRNQFGPEKEELARTTVRAFLQAMIKAIPTGKQNSMAAHNPPSYLLGVVRNAGLWSLANAFVDPVRPKRNSNLIAGSTAALENYWARLVKAYGRENLLDLAVFNLDNPNGAKAADGSPTERPFTDLACFRRDSVEALVDFLVDSSFSNPGKGGR